PAMRLGGALHTSAVRPALSDLLGSAPDKIADHHTDAQREYQRCRQVVLHRIFELINSVVGGFVGPASMAAGVAPKGACEPPDLLAHLIEPILQLVGIDVLDEPVCGRFTFCP